MEKEAAIRARNVAGVPQRIISTSPPGKGEEKDGQGAHALARIQAYDLIPMRVPHPLIIKYRCEWPKV
jgi:hypothetical protein